MPKTNQELIIEFFERNGLNPKYNTRIMEIGAPSVKESFSFYARKKYNVFTISDFTTAKDLIEENMNYEGAKGHLSNGDIYFSTGKDNSHLEVYEEKSSFSESTNERQFIVQSLDDFDTIVSLYRCQDLLELLNLPNKGNDHQLFIGFMAPNKLLSKYIHYYKELTNRLNAIGNTCKFIQEDSFGLIRKR